MRDKSQIRVIELEFGKILNGYGAVADLHSSSIDVVWDFSCVLHHR